MKCEYVGTAETEAAAIAMLEADPNSLFTLIGGNTGLIADDATDFVGKDAGGTIYQQVGDLV